MVLSIILAVILFGVLVTVHELGHFIAAKKCGVGINEFSIGMGPAVFTKVGRDGVKYSVRLLPIGGYVSMVGEDESVNDIVNSDKALSNKPIWQRFIVISAGAFMNILLAVVVMSGIVMTLDSFPTTTVDRINVKVGETGEILTEYYGIKPGDKIVKVGTESVHVYSDAAYEIMRVGKEPTDVTVIRDGKKTVIEDVVFPTFTENGLVFGNAAFFVPVFEGKNVGTVLYQAFFRSLGTVKMIWSSLIDTLTGRYGTEAISGPVGIVNEIGESAKRGTSSLMYLLVLISMNVGIFNLLPLPALDGGRLVFLLIELVRRKPVKPEYEGYVHLAGMAALLCLMLFVTYNDIARLFAK